MRLGIGNEATIRLPNRIDWDAVEALAERQGMLGVVYDGVLRHTDSTENADPHAALDAASPEIPGQARNEVLPLVIKLRWMGKVMQGYEQQYALYRKAVADLAAWYHAHGYRMMLLKGLACGLDWPKPEHRPYGDIDIYLFGQYKEADAEMGQEFKVQGFKVDKSHHHHTVFQWQGFTVENHYDFLNVHHHKSNVELEAILKEFANDGLQLTAYGLQPSANFNALFLLRHAMSHFASTGMNLRQLLDWAFFVEKHGEEVDWVWLQGVLTKYGMVKMFDVMNAICVEDMGFDCLPLTAYGLQLKERVLNDILKPEFSGMTPKHVWKRVPFKYRRWKGNAWKHELCFNDSMGSAFWSGVKNHLMKPSSI